MGEAARGERREAAGGGTVKIDAQIRLQFRQDVACGGRVSALLFNPEAGGRACVKGGEAACEALDARRFLLLLPGHVFLHAFKMLHVHVFLAAPLRTGYVAQSGTDQHKGGIAIRKGSDNACPAPDLAV